MPVQQQDLITAEQFNEYVDSYEEVWGDLYPLSSFSDDDNSLHRWGWGIAPVVPRVNTSTVILSDHINHIIAQVNAGDWHINNSASNLLIKYGNGTQVTHTQFNVVDTAIQTIRSNKFDVGTDIDTVNPSNIVISNNAGVPWQNELNVEIKATFDNYTDARHFFNSGGLISFILSAEGGYHPGLGFEELFETLEDIDIGAEETTNRGTGTSTVQGGFYSATNDGAYQKIFEILHQSSNPDAGSDYANRKVTVFVKAEQTSTFDVYVKVRLSDDIESDNSLFDQTFEIEARPLTPIESPTDAYLASGSNADPFTMGTTVYQFADRTEPVVTIHVPWYTV